MTNIADIVGWFEANSERCADEIMAKMAVAGLGELACMIEMMIVVGRSNGEVSPGGWSRNSCRFSSDSVRSVLSSDQPQPASRTDPGQTS